MSATAVQRDLLAHLARPSLVRWGIRAFWNWLEICSVFIAVHWVDRIWFTLLAMLFLGTRQHALSILGHDGAHCTIHRNRAWNDFLANLVVFWPLGSGIHGYRKFHWDHHRYLGKLQDPELRHKERKPSEWRTPSSSKKILGLVLKDIFLGQGVVNLLIVIQTIKPARMSDRIGPLIVQGSIVAVLYLTETLWVLPIWFGAYLSSFWAIFRLRMWTEHTGTAGVHRVSSNWWQRILFAPHHTYCHWEHHRWPSIPCWNLPASRKLETSEPVLSITKLFQDYPNSPEAPFGFPMEPERQVVNQ